jgi:tetratricopeptide (TPR) repeat protein
VWLLIIFIFAFILRLLYLFQLKGVDPLFYHPIMDALYHHEWAVSIVAGDWLGKDSFFRAPLYPYFLSFVYHTCGINLLVPRIIQSFIGSVNCVLIAMIGTFLFKKRIGVIAGLTAGVYPLFIYFDNELLIPAILMFFVLLGFYMMLRLSARDVSKMGWFFIGIVWGLAAITRPNVLLFLLILPFWLLKRLKEKAKTAILCGALGVLSMIIPITVRNYIVSREFVLVAWQGGINFYIGNNPYSDGVRAVIPGTRETWWGGFHDAKRFAEEALKRKLTNSEIDKYWFYQGFKFIKEKPLHACRLFLQKAYLFFGGFEFSNNRDIYFFTRLTYLKFLIFILPLSQFPFGLVFPLALAGVYIFTRKNKPNWYSKNRRLDTVSMLIFIITYSLSFIIFFVCARYRLVIIPFLIIFASFAVVFFLEQIKEKKFKELVIPLVVFIVSFLFFNANIFHAKPTNPALSYLTMGVSYYEMGRKKEALGCYLKAIEIDPRQAGGYFSIGNIYAEMGKFDEAKNLYLKAIELDPYLALAYNSLGNVYLETLDYVKALECYKKANDLEPDYVMPLYHAGLIYRRLGEFATAESLWKEVLKVDPGHRAAQRALENLNVNKN